MVTAFSRDVARVLQLLTPLHHKVIHSHGVRIDRVCSLEAAPEAALEALSRSLDERPTLLVKLGNEHEQLLLRAAASSCLVVILLSLMLLFDSILEYVLGVLKVLLVILLLFCHWRGARRDQLWLETECGRRRFRIFTGLNALNIDLLLVGLLLIDVVRLDGGFEVLTLPQIRQGDTTTTVLIISIVQAQAVRSVRRSNTAFI